MEFSPMFTQFYRSLPLMLLLLIYEIVIFVTKKKKKKKKKNFLTFFKMVLNK
jgi:hypothetical protein